MSLWLNIWHHRHRGHRAIGSLGLAAGISALAAGLLGQAVRAQSNTAHDAHPQASFRSAVDLVTIRASVHDRRGRPLGGLRAADFEVWDNGTKMNIVGFQADGGAALSVALLMDLSGSMSMGSRVSLSHAAITRVLEGLRPGVDEAALFTFDTSLRQTHAFTTDPLRIAASLPHIEPFGATSLYDAVAGTAERLESRVQAGVHKAIVVVTDGRDTNSTMSPTQVSALASAVDVPVYVIASGPAVDRDRPDGKRTIPAWAAHAQALAEETGGTMYFASTPLEAQAAALVLLEELRQQYVLAIDAAGSLEWRALRVRVSSHSASVRARAGYTSGRPLSN